LSTQRSIWTCFPKSACLFLNSCLVIEPSGSENAKVSDEYADEILPTGLIQRGGEEKYTLLSPSIVRTSVRRSSGPKTVSPLSVIGTPCARSFVQPWFGQSCPPPGKGLIRKCPNV
jgi:hypothetical protein